MIAAIAFEFPRGLLLALPLVCVYYFAPRVVPSVALRFVFTNLIALIYMLVGVRRILAQTFRPI